MRSRVLRCGCIHVWVKECLHDAMWVHIHIGGIMGVHCFGVGIYPQVGVYPKMSVGVKVLTHVCVVCMRVLVEAKLTADLSM